MRRITRSGGTTASEKLGQDIVLLAKFYESGEVSNELTETQNLAMSLDTKQIIF